MRNALADSASIQSLPPLGDFLEEQNQPQHPVSFDGLERDEDRA
jgi:hypothetical protein